MMRLKVIWKITTDKKHAGSDLERSGGFLYSKAAIGTGSHLCGIITVVYVFENSFVPANAMEWMP